MNTIRHRLVKFLLAATICFGSFALVPTTANAAAQDSSLFSSITAGGGQAEQRFGALQARMKGFAVIVLLIMLVVAGIMAAMQKVQMAINIAIGAIILFGGAYIILLLAEGLGAGA